MEAKAEATGKAVLVVNLDEMSVPLAFTHRGGNFMKLDATKQGGSILQRSNSFTRARAPHARATRR